jgi:hypothetical protein
MSTHWQLTIGDKQLANPSWTQIHNALLQMDGDALSIVSLLIKDEEKEQGLVVGGGNGGRYIVTYFPSTKGNSSFVLTDPLLKGPDVKLTVQTPTEYPAHWCVKFSLMAMVVEHFFHNQVVPRDVRWELDDYSGAEAIIE